MERNRNEKKKWNEMKRNETKWKHTVPEGDVVVIIVVLPHSSCYPVVIIVVLSLSDSSRLHLYGVIQFVPLLYYTVVVVPEC
jgi:hypothetical protein